MNITKKLLIVFGLSAAVNTASADAGADANTTVQTGAEIQNAGFANANAEGGRGGQGGSNELQNVGNSGNNSFKGGNTKALGLASQAVTINLQAAKTVCGVSKGWGFSTPLGGISNSKIEGEKFNSNDTAYQIYLADTKREKGKPSQRDLILSKLTNKDQKIATCIVSGIEVGMAYLTTEYDLKTTFEDVRGQNAVALQQAINQGELSLKLVEIMCGMEGHPKHHATCHAGLEAGFHSTFGNLYTSPNPTNH